ncbi:MAG: insulinase family protein [Spirochaetaceae bacterium]|nr:insulinase family protein [Spirochaetaceae bacterium]
MAPTRPGPRGVLLTALVLLSMTVIPAIAQPRVGVPGAPLPFDPAVLRGSLHNGIQYYIARNAEPAGQAQVLLAVRVGSVLEEDDQRGFARFVARMAFRSTARLSEQQIADYLASIGVSEVPGQSVQTGFDASVLHLDIPTGSPDALQTGIEMLGEWAFAITFPPDAVERERALILDASGSDGGIDDSQLAALFGGSRYADRQPAGLREVVEHATPEQLAAFHERWYQPDLMAFIAVGDFDPEAVESAMREHLAPAAQGADGDAGARRRDRTRWPAIAIPDHPEPRVSLLADADAGAAHLTLYRKLEADTGADLPAYRKLLVQRLIAAMINARLAARQQADQPFLSAAVGRNRLTREVDVAIATARAEPGGVERGLSALLAELRRVQVHGFSDAEVAREKAALTRSVEDAYETRDRRPSHVLAEEYLRHFLEAGPYPGIERERELHRLLLPEITPEELHQWAVRNMPSGSSANTVLLVTEPAQDDPAARETLLRDQLIAAAALEVEPYAGTVAGGGAAPLLAVQPAGGSIAAERHVLEIDARRWTLSNGITVIAKHTALGDEVLFHASSPGGSSLLADADFVPALTSATVIAGSGAGPHDSGALDELLADKQVTVTPYIAELFEGFSGSAAPQDLETLFQLIYLYATRPRVDGRFYAQYESQLRAQAEQRESRPEAAFSDTLRIALSQGHFRARPVTPAILEELDLERAVQVYADRFADFSDGTFLFVGAFDWQELRSLAETYLAALPTGARQEQWRDVGIDPPPGIEEHAVRAGSPARAVTRMVFAGDMRWSRGEALALAALGEVLKLRLGERLPGVGGGVGGIGVSSDSQLIPDPEYRVIVGFDSAASRADEARDAVLAEVAWLRRGGERVALEGALAEAKEKLRAARERQVVHNRFWLDQLLTAVRNEEPLPEIARFPERLEALKAEQLVAAARRYLTPDRYVRVVLLPEQDTP